MSEGTVYLLIEDWETPRDLPCFRLLVLHRPMLVLLYVTRPEQIMANPLLTSFSTVNIFRAILYYPVCMMILYCLVVEHSLVASNTLLTATPLLLAGRKYTIEPTSD